MGRESPFSVEYMQQLNQVIAAYIAVVWMLQVEYTVISSSIEEYLCN